ncbi:MAG: hypothetical protein ACNS63_05095 [Candidatus Nitrospinota bacterium M3_3B_026]
MRKLGFLIGIAAVAGVAVALVEIPNPVSGYIIKEAKANGYMEYTPVEAYKLAKRICTQCHTEERIKLYCPRCGPPFVAVVPHMQTFIDNYKRTKPNLKLQNITQHQAAAIAQVWNALVGNWEGDFREQDILKLIGHYDVLKELYKTPVEKRSIEYALMKRDELKIGHMTGLEDLQKDLGKEPSHDHDGHDHDGGAMEDAETKQ